LKPAGNGEETAAGQNTGGFFLSSLRALRLHHHRSLSFRPKGLVAGCVLACVTLAMTAAADEATKTDTAAPRLDRQPSSSHVSADSAGAVNSVPLTEALDELLPDYSSLTHHQLTQIGARWDELTDLERRGLLQEVKLRMARQRGSDRTLQIRTQRRYGRIVRRSDGQVLRIETKVVRVQPVPRAPAERSFGVGFERRTAKPERAGSAADEKTVESPAPSVPVRRVNVPADDQHH
jgi:hypothetical protein